MPTFLLKLYDIVDSAATDSMVSWTEEGDGFIIKLLQDFSNTVLPGYFKHDNFSSFQRQLNMYDFHKFKQKDTNLQIFKHPYFLKDKKS